MSRKWRKREYLKRTDHRLDMSPAGRNLFISRDKQAQNRAARRIRIWMRIVLGLVVVSVSAAAVLFIAFYLAPWFQSEMGMGTGESTEPPPSPSSLAAPLPEYDEMGLPVYGDEISLFTISGDSPAGADDVPELVTEGGVEVDSHMADALRLMSAAAKKDGLALVLTQGYVSYAEQEERYEKKVRELIQEKGLTAVMAKTEAKALEPAPGESDFQSGLCVRLDGDPETFSDSKTYSWLKNNMGKYGFVFRYPEYKEGDTGVKADLTVIRYVGGGHAAAMQQRSMCLEEYLEYLGNQ